MMLQGMKKEFYVLPTAKGKLEMEVCYTESLDSYHVLATLGEITGVANGASKNDVMFFALQHLVEALKYIENES